LAAFRKRRTREHVIADLSVNHVERLILRCGWVPRRSYPDYGVDMTMESYNADGEVENGTILMQIKATDRIVVVKKKAIAVRLDWRDLLFWLNESLVGILVIYDGSEDRAWWLHLQEALRAMIFRIDRAPPETVTLHVPLSNVLDEAAIRSFAKLRDAAAAKTRDV